jgi:hypothetical protein
MTTEKEVVNHVIKYATYVPGTDPEIYTVAWNGDLYSAKDTRKLVLKICKAEGISV